MNKSSRAELRVARLPNAVGSNPLSLAHQLPPTGFLSVRITFMGEAVSRLKLAFYKTDDQGKKGDQVSKDLHTDEHGRAWMEDPVAVGNYWCVIEHQPAVEITTVDAIKHPLIVPIPVGHPRANIG